jgi:hypothetical protein
MYINKHLRSERSFTEIGFLKQKMEFICKSGIQIQLKVECIPKRIMT